MRPDTAEIVKALLVPVVSVLLAGLIGERLSAYWARRRKRQDLAMAASHEFFRLYGEFFAVWKTWNHAVRRASTETRQDDRRMLFLRTSSAEAGLEASLIRLASERVLSNAECETLGRFRQGYQSLREAIGKDELLEWNWAEHPQYRAFKTLACRVASLVASSDRTGSPSPERAIASLLAITANKWAYGWWDPNAAANPQPGPKDLPIAVSD